MATARRLRRSADGGGGDPALVVTSVAAAVSERQNYVSPTESERAVAATGLARLAMGDVSGAGALMDTLGFTVTEDVDPATGRRYGLAVAGPTTPRAWGVYLVDLTGPFELCIAVPHPKSDARCEQLALRLWRAGPAAMLAMSAVHRDAAKGTADHAQNTESVFHHLWTEVVGPRGVPQVQIHGFADSTASEQVVVSTGAGPRTPAAVRIADEIAATGLTTTRSWDGTADVDLRAVGNEQGKAADPSGWVWVHVELSRAVRDATRLWEPAMDAVAAANPALLAYDRPSAGGTGHRPKSVGGANLTGTSRYFAREDHVHRGATATHTHSLEGPNRPVVVPDGETIALDASRGDYFRVRLESSRTLGVPTNGVDAQRVWVEALAVGAARTLTLDVSYRRVTGVARAIRLPAGARWFGQLVHVQDVGWVVVASAVQR
jgi:hypothetical protein